MTEFKNPFTDFDPKQFMGEFKIPNFDADAMMAASKKNFEALAQANQIMIESMQAVAQRQAQIMREAAEQASAAIQDMTKTGAPEQKLAQQADMVKSAMEKAMSNARELAELATKSNQEAVDVINKRVTESLDELREVAVKAGAKK
ncbi:MAG: phasin family protein [Alphaproteobacteria bacterium]|nr:phasin family protein [Alphaproteobacteria bacterium]